MSMILTDDQPKHAMRPGLDLGLARTATGPDDAARPRDARDGMREPFYPRFGKRVFDVVVAGLLLVMLAPLVLFLAVVVAFDGGRPFFAHRRVGQSGKAFPCLKIRSMRHGAEAQLADILARDPAAAREWAEGHKLTNDPRVTRLGRFLRMSSLDELPQLVNVLRGQMSVVGPRPVTFDELSRYGTSAAAYMALKPGLTGPWQVEGRNDLTYEERVALDAGYADQMSFLGDVVIVLKTGLAVLMVTGR